jgi:peptidoglycan DL-endopeptidase CwlO
MPRRNPGPDRRALSPRRRRVRVVVILAITLTLSALVATSASASPESDLAAKKAQAERIQAQLEADHERAEAINEDYLIAKSAADDAQAKIAAAEQGIAHAQEDTKVLRGRLGNRAARLYMSAGAGDPLNFEATDISEYGARAKYTAAAAAQDSRLLDQLKVAEEQLGIERKALEQVQTEARTRQEAADAKLDELKSATVREERALASIKGEMATLVHEITEAREQREREAAQAAVARSSGGGGGGGGGGGRSSSPADIGVDPGNIPAPSGGAAAAVSYARAQIGKPYRYAGAGPDTFDCSGLTMMAWRQGGVGMAHGARAQYAAFPKVPIAQLQPGDLVFFHQPIGHVGIFVGGGTMIEAPHTGAYVRYASIYRRDLQPLGVRPG